MTVRKPNWRGVLLRRPNHRFRWAYRVDVCLFPRAWKERGVYFGAGKLAGGTPAPPRFAGAGADGKPEISKCRCRAPITSELLLYVPKLHRIQLAFDRWRRKNVHFITICKH